MMESHEPLNLISFNTRGLGEIKKRRNIVGWLQKFHKCTFKFVYLQETHSTVKTEAQWKKDWDNRKIYYSHGDSSSRGVAIILPKNTEYKVIEVTRSSNSRYVTINLETENSTFCFTPNTIKPKEQLKWLNEIQEILLKTIILI